MQVIEFTIPRPLFLELRQDLSPCFFESTNAPVQYLNPPNALSTLVTNSDTNPNTGTSSDAGSNTNTDPTTNCGQEEWVSVLAPLAVQEVLDAHSIPFRVINTLGLNTEDNWLPFLTVLCLREPDKTIRISLEEGIASTEFEGWVLVATPHHDHFSLQVMKPGECGDHLKAGGE